MLPDDPVVLKRIIADQDARITRLASALWTARRHGEALEQVAPPLRMIRREIYDEAQSVNRLRAERRYDEADALKKSIEGMYGVRIYVTGNSLVVQEE